MKDFYLNKIKEIKKQMKLNKNFASKLLIEELNMPYIPQKYEIQFQKLWNELNLKNNQPIIKKILTKKEIIVFLNSNNKIKVAVAIDFLKHYNLRNIVNELKKWIEEPNNDSIGKTFLYEALVEQEININLNIDDIKINPKLNKSFFNNLEINKAFQIISNLFDKDPQLKEIAKAQLKLYILLSFPFKLENSNKIAQNIFNIIQFMMNHNKKLSNEEKYIYKMLKI